MKPRGLMIIHNFRPGPVGGAELQAERLAGQMVKMGHPMQVLTWLTVPGAPLQETCDGVVVHRVPHRLPYWVRRDNAETFRFLARARHTYDVLHAHMAFGHAVVAVVTARLFGKKCLVKIACTGEYGDLCSFSKFPGFDRALRVLHHADAAVATSREVEQELLQFGFFRERIHRIPNGVDTLRFTRSQPFPDRPRCRFVLIGRRHPQKGIDTALLAAQRLKQQGFGKQFEIHMHGADYPEHDYNAMARETGVTDVVHLKPFEPDVARIYESAHCMLLPSRGEGLSNSLLEAMSMELPVIATPVSGTPDVVDDGHNGILVPPDSPEALADAMIRIITQPEQCALLGKRARRTVESRFSLESVANSYSDLYTRLCAR